MNKKAKLIAAASLAIAGLSTSVYATLITYGWKTIYYSDALHTKQVGSDSKPCNGERTVSGKVTPYRSDVYYICRSEAEM